MTDFFFPFFFFFRKGFLPTWRWLAPEVINVENIYYDEKADIYSFGMVLWEIVTGDAPFFEYENMRELQIKNAIIRENLRPSIPEDCPTELASLIIRCWDSDPLKRPHFKESCNILLGFVQKFGALPELDMSTLPMNGSLNNVSTPSVREIQFTDYSKFHDFHSSISNVSLQSNSDTPFQKVDDLSSLSVAPIYSLALVGNLIWSGHANGYISIWDIDVSLSLLLFSSPPPLFFPSSFYSSFLFLFRDFSLFWGIYHATYLPLPFYWMRKSHPSPPLFPSSFHSSIICLFLYFWRH